MLSAWLAGCGAFLPPPDMAASVGTVNDGSLRRGQSFPRTALGVERARPEDPTAFGTPGLVGAVTRAGAVVATAFAGTAPLRVGDASWPGGGAHPRHRSHRAGRDVDVLFYARDGAGNSVRGTGFVAFDRFGVGQHRHAVSSPETAGDAGAGVIPAGPLFFDDARNWAFVRALLTDPSVDLQWVFCSDGIKARLLRYAAIMEPDAEVLFRAAWVLHQPTNGRPHDDHFHVRVACAPEEAAAGCLDVEPLWPWFERARKFDAPGYAVSDAVLVDALLEGALSEDAPRSGVPAGAAGSAP